MENLKDIRWKQRFENFEKTYRSLDKYVDNWNFTELERAGIIQMFEICFELSWNLMKDYLEAEGYEINSPRSAIKKSFETGLVSNGELWLEALLSRNMTVHTYDEAKSEAMEKKIKEDYFPIMQELYLKLKKEKQNVWNKG